MTDTPPRPLASDKAPLNRMPRFRASDPAGWSEDRSSLHHASWIAGSVAFAALPARSDDAQTNLAIRPRDGEFVTHPLDQNGALSLRLDVRRLELTFRDGAAREDSLGMIGRTIDEVLGACGDVLREVGLVEEPIKLRPYPDFPDHPLGQGQVFTPGNPEARSVLFDSFALADEAFLRLGDRVPALGNARLWPHHFDLGALIDLGEGRQIGLGFSPGDESIEQPYYYVAGYPTPDLSAPPQLEHGQFTRTGFQGALLLACDPDDPRANQTTDAFLLEAVNATRELLLA